MTASRACALVVFLLPSLPLYASGAGAPTIKLVKGECVAEVELTRASLRGGSIDYAVSIRHEDRLGQPQFSNSLTLRRGVFVHAAAAGERNLAA